MVQAAAARQLTRRALETACTGAMAPGDVCNACPYPVAFRSAYQLSPNEQGDPFGSVDYPTNCSDVISALPGTTAHLWLCLTPWETLAPGAALHLPLDAPVPPWVVEQNATEALWWQYTAHVANADGSAYSLTRGSLGSQLLRVAAEVREAERGAVLGPQPEFPTGPEEERVPCYPPHAPTAADCTWWTRAPPVVRAPPDWDSAGSLVLRCPDYPGPAANGAAGWLPPDVAPLQVHSECPQAVAFTAAFPMDGGEHACTQDEGLGGDQAPDYGSGMCVTRRVTLRPNQTAVIDATRAGPGGGLPAGSWFSAYVARLQDADDPSPTRYWLSAVAQPRSRCFWPGAEWSNLPEAQPTEDTFYVWAPLPQAGAQGTPTVAVQRDATIVLRCPPEHQTGNGFAQLCQAAV